MDKPHNRIEKLFDAVTGKRKIQPAEETLDKFWKKQLKKLWRTEINSLVNRDYIYEMIRNSYWELYNKLGDKK